MFINNKPDSNWDLYIYDTPSSMEWYCQDKPEWKNKPND